MDNDTLKWLAAVSNRIDTEKEWSDELAERKENAMGALKMRGVKPVGQGSASYGRAYDK